MQCLINLIQQVHDCFDPVLSEEIGRNKVDWMRNHISSDDFKIVVVESSLAVIRQQALLHHIKVGYREPTWLDELFIYGLKELTDDLHRNVYQHVFVIRYVIISFFFVFFPHNPCH
jgi:hypothetical protein